MDSDNSNLCPECDSPLLERDTVRMTMWDCTNPDCDYTNDDL